MWKQQLDDLMTLAAGDVPTVARYIGVTTDRLESWLHYGYWPQVSQRRRIADALKKAKLTPPVIHEVTI